MELNTAYFAFKFSSIWWVIEANSDIILFDRLDGTESNVLLSYKNAKSVSTSDLKYNGKGWKYTPILVSSVERKSLNLLQDTTRKQVPGPTKSTLTTNQPFTLFLCFLTFTSTPYTQDNFQKPEGKWVELEIIY